MPDPAPSPQTNSTVQIVSLVLTFLQTIVMAWLTVQANNNHEKLASVEGKQAQAVEETAEVKRDLNKRADQVDKKAKNDAQATAINLWSTWKYLENLAAAPGATSKDAEKAIEAKKTYEDFVTRNPKN